MPSRSAAHRAIVEGRVSVAGIAHPRPATRVSAEVAVSVDPDATRFVGRGGLKLAAALETFGIAVHDRTALDVGSSTGGFTDCLLQAGAVGVVAVDVGTAQLHDVLRGDARVTALEQTDIRDVEPAAVGAPFGIVVADVSFLSLARLAVTIARFGDDHTDYVMLVKPQFEAGPGRRSKRGVVAEEADRRRAVASVTSTFADLGLTVRGEITSPIRGAAGNVEYLLWLQSAGVVTPQRQDDPDE